MRDEKYGITVIAFTAGLYGFLAWTGLVHSMATLKGIATLTPPANAAVVVAARP